MNYLTLSLPGFNTINAPKTIPTNGDLVPKIIGAAVDLLFIIATLYALWMLLRGGISWIYSEGDKQRLEASRNRIVYAILGLIIVLLSYVFVSFIAIIFGVDLLSL